MAGADHPYKSKDWLYKHYVQRRMNLTDIQKLLKNSYNIEVTSQTIYNYAKKFDLLRFRGRGRQLGKLNKQPKSPMAERAAQLKRDKLKRMKQHGQTKRHPR